MPIEPRKILGSATRVARPANPLRAVQVAEPAAERPEGWRGTLTPEAIRGLLVSLSIHAAFLLVLAFWYFAGPDRGSARTIETRLAGSEFGVAEGTSNDGGFDSPLGDMEALPAPSATQPLAASPAVVLDAAKLLGPTASAAGTDGGDPNRGGAPGAGNGEGFGLARFGSGGERIGGVEVKVGDPQFTLIWDSEADLDLHVIEPGGSEIYWEVRNGKQGGELDVDDVDGHGPENVYWLQDGPDESEKVKGRGPAGEYRWYVHYYGGFGGISKPSPWKVRIKHSGQVTVIRGKLSTIGQKSKGYTVKVEFRDPLLDGLFGGGTEPAR